MKFYTYAPIEYPFILRNIKQKPKKWFLHEIVDIGIYDLLKEPFKHSEGKLWKWKKLVTPGWKVVPDCPDIQKEFNSESKIDNVKYSKELMLKYYEPRDDTHLPVIQGYQDNPESIDEYCYWFREQYGQKYGIPFKFGVGTMCKSGSKESVIKSAQIVRKHFPNVWIHIFGLKMNHYIGVSPYINSWDSMSWTFPRGIGRGSAKNKLEKEQFFAEYIESIPKRNHGNKVLEVFKDML